MLLFIIGLFFSVMFVIGVFCKIAKIEQPASSVANSPIRSAVRRVCFPTRDMTPEQLRSRAESASIDARRAEVEAIQNAIMIASVTSSQIKH